MPIRERTESVPAQREGNAKEPEASGVSQSTAGSVWDGNLWIMSVSVRKGYDEFMNWWDA